MEKGRSSEMTRRIVDLSQLVFSGQEEYRLDLNTAMLEEFLPQYHRDPDQWYVMTEVTLWSHVGTHIEAPLHFIEKGPDVADLPLERLIGPAVIVDFRDKQTNEAITLAELQERAVIEVGDMVIIQTGRDALYRTPQAHDRPYLSVEAVEWMIADRKVAVVGTDASGFEVRGDEAHPNHQALLGKGIPILEHLTNLEALSQSRVTLIALPWKVRGMDSCPVRVVAIEGDSLI
jgi:arylformamidase